MQRFLSFTMVCCVLILSTTITTTSSHLLRPAFYHVFGGGVSALLTSVGPRRREGEVGVLDHGRKITTATRTATTRTATRKGTRTINSCAPLKAGMMATRNGDTNATNALGKDPADGSRRKVVLDPLIVCGPSGVGKGTIIERFMKKNSVQQHVDYDQKNDELKNHHQNEKKEGKYRFAFAVSHTTRSPRPGEVNGVHYNFVTVEEMEEAVACGKFVEHARVHGNLYGTSWESLAVPAAAEQQPTATTKRLLDIDVQGVQAIKKRQEEEEQKQQTLLLLDDGDELNSSSTLTNSECYYDWKPRYVFIAPPSLEVLLERLSLRGTEDTASLQRRTANAASELEYGLAEGNFDAIIVNDDLDDACRDFEQIVEELYTRRDDGE